MGLGWNLYNLKFHFALYASRLGFGHESFSEVSGKPLKKIDFIPDKLRIHFWIPNETAGSMVIIHNMLPALRKQLRQLDVNWELETSSHLPTREVDWLFCFKSVPSRQKLFGNPRCVLLICDQAEVFWKDVPLFDQVLATSSPQFARLLALRHNKVSYLSEAEPEMHLEFGCRTLAENAAREPILFWHGGKHSLKALYSLKTQLADWAAEHPEASLHIICGSAEDQTDQWGSLKIRYYPWSIDQLHASARIARVALIPAIDRLKHSWLKPASRVRCCYAMGLPAIGDQHVPEVASFMESFGGPVVKKTVNWRTELERLWSNPEECYRVAKAGHAKVEAEFSMSVAARRWVRYLSTPRLN